MHIGPRSGTVTTMKPDVESIALHAATLPVSSADVSNALLDEARELIDRVEIDGLSPGDADEMASIIMLTQLKPPPTFEAKKHFVEMVRAFTARSRYRLRFNMPVDRPSGVFQEVTASLFPRHGSIKVTAASGETGMFSGPRKWDFVDLVPFGDLKRRRADSAISAVQRKIAR